tara:strand:+ start:20 stop:541 length:522 start_codon:yes stop_codon:yes gene_type:complete
MGSTLIVDEIQGATTAANVKFPAGSILQVQTAIQHGGSVPQTTSTSMVATGHTVSITPKYNNSIIMLYYSASFTSLSNNGTGGTAMKFYKSVGGGAYSVVTSQTNTQNAGFLEYSSGTGNYNHSVGTMMVTDAPATTSAITYQLYFQRVGSVSNASIQEDWGGTHFHAMEIAQ